MTRTYYLTILGERLGYGTAGQAVTAHQLRAIARRQLCELVASAAGASVHGNVMEPGSGRRYATALVAHP